MMSIYLLKAILILLCSSGTADGRCASVCKVLNVIQAL